MSEKPLPPINADTQAFWEGCASGELRVQRCDDCGVSQLPPRARCTGCGGTSLAWAAVAPHGTVHSFTVVHRAPSAAFRDDVPYVIALVDVADTDRARLMMNVAGCAPQAVHIGMPVRIAFVPRHGADGRVAWLPEARAQASA